jgi:tRNA (adenine57-N1/adenine58-N1)-methyltransferase
MPNIDNLTIRMADVYEGVQEREVDRIVLDVPEPWRVAPSALEALVPGGLFLAFLPTALQVHELVNALRNTGRFRLVETQEVLTRSWHVTRSSLRPDHRMVAHTGFLVRARKTSARPHVDLDSERDESLPEAEFLRPAHSQQEVNKWTEP